LTARNGIRVYIEEIPGSSKPIEGVGTSIPSYLYPGVYIEEIPAASKPIEGVGTSVAGFVGLAPGGPVNTPVQRGAREASRGLWGACSTGDEDKPEKDAGVVASGGNCIDGYSPCLPPASDYDCAGGSGDGPEYANGPIQVSGSDPYELDSDGDGVACESYWWLGRLGVGSMPSLASWGM
jgi:hypothetical protein